MTKASPMSLKVVFAMLLMMLTIVTTKKIEIMIPPMISSNVRFIDFHKQVCFIKLLLDACIFVEEGCFVFSIV